MQLQKLQKNDAKDTGVIFNLTQPIHYYKITSSINFRLLMKQKVDTKKFFYNFVSQWGLSNWNTNKWIKT